MSLRAEVAQAYARLRDAGLVAGASGNVSAVDRAAGTVAITPRGGAAGLGEPDVSVLELASGEHRAGPPPSSELPTHLALLRHGAGAVVHTHQPHAVALGLVADRLPAILAEQVVYCGGEVPVLPYVPTGTSAMAEAVAAVHARGAARAVMIRGHGPFAWGATLAAALAGALALEEAARAWLLARAAGAEPFRLPGEEVERLLALPPP